MKKHKCKICRKPIRWVKSINEWKKFNLNGDIHDCKNNELSYKKTLKQQKLTRKFLKRNGLIGIPKRIIIKRSKQEIVNDKARLQNAYINAFKDDEMIELLLKRNTT
jgi:hypothetical protein